MNLLQQRSEQRKQTMTYAIIRKALQLKKTCGVRMTALYLKKHGVSLEEANKILTGRGL